MREEEKKTEERLQNLSVPSKLFSLERRLIRCYTDDETMKEKNLKYGMPEFLNGISNQVSYHRWLHRKAIAHIRRDRKRGNKMGTNEEYKIAIHSAVCESRGKDAYTGEALAWDLIGTYDNGQSQLEKRLYKTKLALLPTVDHVGDGTGKTDFNICSWRTNDAKNDMTISAFVKLCQLVVDYHMDRARLGLQNK